MVSSRPEIVILCGGEGRRMKELTANTQKCLLLVDQKPILSYLLDQISSALERARVILVVGHGSASMHRVFGKRFKQLQLTYTAASTQGPREALLEAEALVQHDHFVVVHGNTVIK